MQGVSLLDGLEDVDVNVELLDLGSLQSVLDFAKRFKASNTKVGIVLPRNNERGPGSTFASLVLMEFR